ncbi:aromatic ring-hydroxylating oxygenase subunit alpha [Ilumatobacter nonamiensis]|uniref:aromatic ring-hydroxylating oxygenase subunit alpha n=1 Tax=Ilumatobacter nonamiensis TaxID=467093 RepID=UPI00130E1EE7|nr:aromatic ring-hydroxylating dioxygenase subunit alpha [Ilumatobacter nonamiensis]
MVHIPTRGDVPVRLGGDVQLLPDYGPSTMSADVYRDPVRFELERELVLGAHWIVAGRSEQIVGTGDWLTFEGHGETVVVTRQKDGSLAAFHNVCQHRGPAIVGEQVGCGARRFTCPYHGWVYDTTGLVVGVPEREDFDEAHLDGLRSPAVAADEWGGWVWINLAGPDRAEPLLDAIGPEIDADLGRFRMEDMVLHEVVEWDVPVSYKAIVDGFNEIYHTKQLHGVSSEWVKAARQTSFHIVDDNYMCFVPRSDKLDQIAEDPDHHRFAICHYVVFPNTVFNCNPEHVQVFNPIPIDVDRTRFLCWELIYPGDRDDPEYAAYHDRTMAHWKGLKKVVGEDIEIYEQLERTKRSSGYTRHVLNERECKIAHYHENMDRKIRKSR